MVTVPHNARIVHIRKAVKDANAGDLDGVDASDLKIFKSQAELKGKGEPLAASMLVRTLGEAGKMFGNELLVVVPGNSPRMYLMR
jgi:hypothetical protein